VAEFDLITQAGDGSLESWNADWATARAGDHLFNPGPPGYLGAFINTAVEPDRYYIYRLFLLFDAVVLAGHVVTSASLFIYHESESGMPSPVGEICVVGSTFTPPVGVVDWGLVEGGELASRVPLSNPSGWQEVPLDVAGVAWVQAALGGDVLMALRVGYDVDDDDGVPVDASTVLITLSDGDELLRAYLHVTVADGPVTHEVSAGLGAGVAEGASVSSAMDAGVAQGRTGLAGLGGAVQAEDSREAGLDAAIQTWASVGLSFGGAVAAVGAGVLSLDAKVVAAGSVQAGMDSKVVISGTPGAGFDAVVKMEGDARTVGMNAGLQVKDIMRTMDADAALAWNISKTAGLDVFLMPLFPSGHRVGFHGQRGAAGGEGRLASAVERVRRVYADESDRIAERGLE
jgi:hypothetical protein